MKHTTHVLDRYGNVEIFNRHKVRENSPEWDIPYYVIKCTCKECPNYEIFWGDAVNTTWNNMVLEDYFWFITASYTKHDKWICINCIKAL